MIDGRVRIAEICRTAVDPHTRVDVERGYETRGLPGSDVRAERTRARYDMSKESDSQRRRQGTNVDSENEESRTGESRKEHTLWQTRQSQNVRNEHMAIKAVEQIIHNNGMNNGW